jgi:RHS repeat-associated protein
MMPAAKHFDPVMGVDIHIIQPPGPVPPVPVPHPFVGYVSDPMDNIPVTGATVKINGVNRAIAGTQGVCMPPHIPIGGTFIKPPANECEIFMGSATVMADGDALSHMSQKVLSCHCVGMPPVTRPWKKGAVKSLVAPTSNVLPIPAGPPVLVGGPPTIMLMKLPSKPAMAAMAKAMKKFAKSPSKKRPKNTKNLKSPTPPHNKACGQAGEPIDVVSGANVDEFNDFNHPSYPALVWKRFYKSNNLSNGPLGIGFRHNFQHEVEFLTDRVRYRLPDGDIAELPLPEAVISTDSKDSLEVLQCEFNGFQLRGSHKSKWTLSAPFSPTLEFVSRRDGATQLMRLVDPKGNIEILYDDQNRMCGVSSEDGTQLKFDLSQSGNIQEVTLVVGREKTSITAYQYNERGCLTRWTDGHGNVAKYDFDEDRRMIRKVDRNGYAYHYEYDSQGRCIHTYGQDGLYDVALTYDPDNQRTLATWGDGAQTSYHYDELGALIKIIDATGGITMFEMNEAGSVASQIDPNGDVTEHVYDSAGGNIGRVDASGQRLLPIHLQPHRPYGLDIQLPAASEGWIAGEKAERTEAQKASIQTQVASAAKAPDAITNPDSRERVEEIEYDSIGRTIQKRIDKSKRQTTWGYDANGNATNTVDEDGSRWSYRYTSWNLLDEEQTPLGNTIRYEYNLREAITKVLDGGGTETVYELDKCDRIAAVHRGGKLKERYVYNQSGGLIEKYDRDGNCLLKIEPGPYDTHAAIELLEGPRIEFNHDEVARVVAASDGNCQLLRQYSSTSELVLDFCNGKGMEREWIKPNIKQLKLLKRFSTCYEQKPDGSVNLVDPTGGKHLLRRDTVGRFSVYSESGIHQIMAFDDRGLTRSQFVDGLADGAWTRAYEYSAAGNLRFVNDSREGKTEYRYDAAHRLIAEIDSRGKQQSFGYDSADNLLVQQGLSGVKVGPANQLERTSDEQFEYNSRMHVSKRTHVDGTTTEYFYDALDRLIHIKRSDGLDWRATYDPLGRRINKSWTAPDGSKHTVDFYWDEHRLAGEITNEKQLRIYIYSDDSALTPILMVDYASATAKPESGQVFSILHDQRGQPIDIRDMSGKGVWSTKPAPYGAAPQSNNSFSMPLRMPGHYDDSESQLFYNRHRYYDPSIARYIQTDPIGLRGGKNLYGYTPKCLVNVDLQGLHPQSASNAGSSGGGSSPTSEKSP